LTPALLTLLTFIAGGLAVAGVYSIVSDLFLRERAHVAQRVDAEFRQRLRDQVRRSKLFKEPARGKIADFAADKDTGPPGLWQRFETMVEQSAIPLSAQKLLGIAGASGLILGIVSGIYWENTFAGLFIGLIGLGAPLLYVRMKRQRRLDRLMAQMPDAFDLMARVIRAGQTMGQAFQAVADEFQAPIAAEFSYCYEQQNLGLSPEVALRDLARRTGLIEMSIFVMAVIVQRQTGGNLAELLEKLAAVVRERFRIKGKIQVLTSQGRLEAAILLAMPPVVFLLVMFLNPHYAQGLLDHPNLILGMLVSMLFGALWIRKIINFDF